jgi:hypothetical protein
MTFGSKMFQGLSDMVASRHEPEGMRALSSFYWRTLIVTALVVLAAVFSYSIWGLLRVLNNLGAASGASTLPPSALNRVALEEVVRGFEKRQEQFELLKRNRVVTIPDPR